MIVVNRAAAETNFLECICEIKRAKACWAGGVIALSVAVVIAADRERPTNQAGLKLHTRRRVAIAADDAPADEPRAGRNTKWWRKPSNGIRRGLRRYLRYVGPPLVPRRRAARRRACRADEPCGQCRSAAGRVHYSRARARRWIFMRARPDARAKPRAARRAAGAAEHLHALGDGLVLARYVPQDRNCRSTIPTWAAIARKNARSAARGPGKSPPSRLRSRMAARAATHRYPRRVRAADTPPSGRREKLAILPLAPAGRLLSTGTPTAHASDSMLTESGVTTMRSAYAR